MKLQRYCVRHSNSDDYRQVIEGKSDEQIANLAITLIHQFDGMMGKLIDKLQSDFTEHGGIRERMYAARTQYRNDQQTRIAALEAENTQLRNRITELEQALQQKGGRV